MSISRDILPPAPGSPNWQPPGEPPGGLLYLGWGRRQYGIHPIPPRMHRGWTYTAVLGGHPTMIVGNQSRVMKTGDLAIVGPDVPFGWQDHSEAVSSLLVWVWRNAPKTSHESPLTQRTCWIRTGRARALQKMREIHAETRREIMLADNYSPDLLCSLQLRLDAEFARASASFTDNRPRNERRLQLAREWMQRNLALRSPIAALADYLGISAMSLSRLFRQEADISPGEACLQIKMLEATRLLATPGVSVKAVALDLGYRHAGDFTRAFSRFHGEPPSAHLKKCADQLDAHHSNGFKHGR